MAIDPATKRHRVAATSRDRDDGATRRRDVHGLADAIPELDAIERSTRHTRALDGVARAEVLAVARGGGLELPVHAVTCGSADPEAPAVVLVGGVHGLERIGTRVVATYLETALARLSWDRIYRHNLERVRLGLVPLVNPVGMALGRRANGRGVDLMRNAPPHPDSWATPLVGGQRWSPRLPWFMGDEDRMEPETAALEAYLRREVFASPCVICIDVHSGFGAVDRLWFPYARTRRPMPHLPELHAFKGILDHSLPHHVYRIEPQAKTYTIEGDFWDYVYDEYRAARPDGVMLQLTLELGSWLWVKKNPRQLFTRLGSFNPIVPHRLRRTLRRHMPLFDLALRAAASRDAWATLAPERREHHARAAFEAWYA